MTACNHGGKLDADGFLLGDREGVDQAVNGFGRPGGVERAKNQSGLFPPP